MYSELNLYGNLVHTSIAYLQWLWSHFRVLGRMIEVRSLKQGYLPVYVEMIDVKISLDWQQGCTKYFIPGYLTPFRFVCAYLFWSPKLPSWCSSICDVMVSHWKSWFMTPQTLDLRDGSFGGQNKCAQTNRNGANYPGIKYYLHPRCQSRDIFTSIISTYTGFRRNELRSSSPVDMNTVCLWESLTFQLSIINSGT